VFLDLGGEAQQTHDLRDAGAGEAFAVSDLGLVGGLAGLEKGPPLDGLAEEFDHAGRLGLPGPA